MKVCRTCRAPFGYQPTERGTPCHKTPKQCKLKDLPKMYFTWISTSFSFMFLKDSTLSYIFFLFRWPFSNFFLFTFVDYMCFRTLNYMHIQWIYFHNNGSLKDYYRCLPSYFCFQSVYDTKNSFCLFDRPFKIQKNGVFFLKYLLSF